MVSAFAVEATMPEAMDIDQYVRGGPGDPVKLLSRLWFWTTRNQEMADILRWMRQYNSGVPANQQIRFYGVDMQYPGGAVRKITAWIPPSMSGLAAMVNAGYACIKPFINDDAGVFPRDIDAESQEVRDRCLAGAQAAAAEIAANAPSLRTAVGDDSYDMHARLAETLVQWTTLHAKKELQYRDRAMAENALWVLSRGSGRVVLSEHNGHVTTRPGTMGQRLRQALGDGYLAVGFAFDSGSFNAHPSVSEAVGEVRSATLAPDSYEEFFHRFPVPFYFDTRHANGFLPRQFRVGPRGLREIGALYYEGSPNLVFYQASLMNDWDVMFWLPRLSPTRLLPFTP
jgi:erythromycin esterase